MSGQDIEPLQAMFPDASADALRAVLALTGGDLNAATNFLLSNDLEEVEAEVVAGGGGGGGAAQGGGAEGTEEDEEDGGDDGTLNEEDDEDEDEDDDEHLTRRDTKRLKTVQLGFGRVASETRFGLGWLTLCRYAGRADPTREAR